MRPDHPARSTLHEALAIAHAGSSLQEAMREQFVGSPDKRLLPGRARLGRAPMAAAIPHELPARGAPGLRLPRGIARRWTGRIWPQICRFRVGEGVTGPVQFLSRAKDVIGLNTFDRDLDRLS